MIHVLIADDHEVVRRGLRELFAAAADVTVVAEVAHGRAVLDVLEKAHVDVLVLDLSLPRVSGIEVLRRTRERYPAVRVLVLSMYAEAQYASRLVQEGAAGYLSKDRSLDEVLDAVRVVARGQRLVPPAEAPETTKLPHESLSSREYNVFLLILQGRTGSEIAAELDLSHSTVSTHLARVREKLGVRTNGEIVGYGHRNGLVG